MHPNSAMQAGYDANVFRLLTDENIAVLNATGWGQRRLPTTAGGDGDPPTQNMTSAATTHDVYDRQGYLIIEASSSDDTVREYVWLNDMPLANVANKPIRCGACQRPEV